MEREIVMFEPILYWEDPRIVRCPACGRLSRIPYLEEEYWRCLCSPEQSRLILEDLLDDQKNVVLERSAADPTGSDFPKLEGCKLLEHVTIKGYDTIPAVAFSSCSRLQSVQLDNTVTVIDSDAFSYCSALEKIDLPDGLLRIGRDAFCDSGLRRIVLPDSLQRMEEGAFQKCRHLTDVKLF